MSETGPNSLSERRPACRTTHPSGEKRQRVLLSTKYEDAVQDLNRQLADVKEMLHSLMLNKESRSQTLGLQTVSSDTAHTPKSMIDEQMPVLNNVQDGYNGNTSFISHADEIRTTLGATFAPCELETSPSAALGDSRYHENGTDITSSRNSYLEPENLNSVNMPLPPSDIVLKLLRLIKTEEQPAFVNLPILPEDEFIEMCRNVYFATEPISLWTWICVNVGLYFLFTTVSAPSCKSLGITVDELRAHAETPKANAERALQSLRLCSEPSLESCRALAVLANFYVKEGHNTIAWRLTAGAARAALDIGLHRLTNSSASHRGLEIFWHIFIWEKGLAMTCGKSPTIRHFDVTMDLHKLPLPPPQEGRRGILYRACGELAVVMGDIEESLFSVVAQKQSQQDRFDHVSRLATRITEILNYLMTARPDDSTWETIKASNTGGIETLLPIVLHCQLAIVYRFLPAGFLGAHPLQCSTECVNESRVALSMLVRVGEEAVVRHVEQWTVFLNVVLSLVPLGPFIVLAGNAIATSSGDDLVLLSKMTSLLAPAAEKSPHIRKVHNACESLYSIADRIISSTSPPDFDNAQQMFPQETDHFAYTFPMGQQDWDSVMMGLDDSQLSNYDSQTVTHIMEPGFVNTYW
ncbi:hypothetical protein NPX13_g1911 [Xylaria arbuscula]|uniref:Xylanolytic transcriptional activator regulatory domain-containing protein n=1 Tax=Xylaria arbuscula TaxID=114810 RepID=A0A9W8TQW8_9PEZI|nr:hypothetical protein NPX13_g1911 [Xylaria arbuscula]